MRSRILQKYLKLRNLRQIPSYIRYATGELAGIMSVMTAVAAKVTKPVAVHIPVPVPLPWMKKVKEDLDQD